jgi:hypothetical protein
MRPRLGYCYTTKCYTMEDGLTECASEGKVVGYDRVVISLIGIGLGKVAGYDRVVRSPIEKGSGKEVE